MTEPGFQHRYPNPFERQFHTKYAMDISATGTTAHYITVVDEDRIKLPSRPRGFSFACVIKRDNAADNQRLVMWGEIAGKAVQVLDASANNDDYGMSVGRDTTDAVSVSNEAFGDSHGYVFLCFNYNEIDGCRIFRSGFLEQSIVDRTMREVSYASQTVGSGDTSDMYAGTHLSWRVGSRNSASTTWEGQILWFMWMNHDGGLPGAQAIFDWSRNVHPMPLFMQRQVSILSVPGMTGVEANDGIAAEDEQRVTNLIHLGPRLKFDFDAGSTNPFTRSNRSGPQYLGYRRMRSTGLFVPVPIIGSSAVDCRLIAVVG